MPIRVMVVGTGPMASDHIQVLRAIPEFEVVGIAGRTEASTAPLAQKFSIHGVSGPINHAFSTLAPDVVVSAVPMVSNYEVHRDLIALPATLLLEKPIALRLSESERLLELSKYRDSPVFVGHNRRFYSVVDQAMRLLSLHPGHRTIRVQDQQTFDYPQSRSWHEKDAVHWPLGNSIHLVDLLRYFCRGSVNQVTQTGHFQVSREPQLITAQVAFDSGDLGTYSAIWEDAGGWAVHISNATIEIELKPIEVGRWRYRGASRWTPLQKDRVDERFKPGLYRQATELRKGHYRQANAALTLGEAVTSIRLLAEIYSLID